MKKTILTLFTAFALSFALHGQETNSLLWKIQAPGAAEPSFLFGTYHLIGAEYLESHEKVNDAYENASTVVVEAVIDSTELMEMAMLSMMPNNSLKNLLDSTEYQLVKEELERELGINMVLLDQMKPISVATLYTGAMAEEATPEDFKFDGMPIDLYFAANGEKQGKKIMPLETMIEQMHMLMDSIPLEDQADALVEMVREKELGEEVTAGILEAYREEDLEALWEYAQNEEDLAEMNFFVDDRNKRWVHKLRPLLREGDVFIAVGALHLPGENGLLKLLEGEGYSVSPVK